MPTNSSELDSLNSFLLKPCVNVALQIKATKTTQTKTTFKVTRNIGLIFEVLVVKCVKKCMVLDNVFIGELGMIVH